MKRGASAEWKGDLKTGKGLISLGSGALKSAPYSFTTRFEPGVTGTNPEELIGGAHASCFSMALSAQLSGAGLKPEPPIPASPGPLSAQDSMRAGAVTALFAAIRGPPF